VIVNVIGNGGKVASPTHLAGGAANAALMLATAGLATAYAGKRCRVVGLNPGRNRDRARRRGHAGRSQARRHLPRKKRGNARSPGFPWAAWHARRHRQCGAFLASDKAGYITGATVTMDGGMVPVVV
jgi:Dehydrogenases with different specificities (related to short-chain alcohol dehydrogenases)